MVALDALLQVLGCVMDGVRGKHPFVRRLGDGPGVDASAVSSQAIRGKQRLIRQHLPEETLRAGQIALGRQQEVNRCAVFVDRSIEITPFAANFHIGLINANGAAMWAAELAQPLFDQRA